MGPTSFTDGNSLGAGGGSESMLKDGSSIESSAGKLVSGAPVMFGFESKSAPNRASAIC